MQKILMVQETSFLYLHVCEPVNVKTVLASTTEVGLGFSLPLVCGEF